MQPAALVGEVVRAVAARVDFGSDGSSTGVAAIGRVDHWFFAAASVLALLGVSSATVRVVRRLARGSVPELMVLLEESAAFYRCWPEDRLDAAPRERLVAEVARCLRIVELLESPCRDREAALREPTLQGPVVGLRSWIALLLSRIDGHSHRPSGAAYV